MFHFQALVPYLQSPHDIPHHAVASSISTICSSNSHLPQCWLIGAGSLLELSKAGATSLGQSVSKPFDACAFGYEQQLCTVQRIACLREPRFPLTKKIAKIPRKALQQGNIIGKITRIQAHAP